MDRRKRKTQIALQNSLIDLLSVKEIGNISIRELAEKADVNRSTFYVNYQDIYELLEQLETDLSASLGSLLAEGTISDQQFWEHVLSYLQQEKKLLRLIFCSPSGGKLASTFQAELENHYKLYYQENLKRELTSQEESFILYHVAGLTRIIQDWLVADKRQEQLRILLEETDRQLDKWILCSYSHQ